MTNSRPVTLLAFLALLAGISCGKKKLEATTPPAPSAPGKTAVAPASPTPVLTGGLLLERVYFPLDRWALTVDATRTLSEDAKHLLANPGLRIRVEGHADERGGTVYNLALSEKRAAAVRTYLIDLGIAADRIESVAYGEERPRATGHDESAWSKNRRGELEVTGGSSTSAR